MTALGDKAVQLAQSLIRCESVTPADAGALEVLIQALKPARFTFWRLNFKEEGTPPVDNLYARIGDGPPHLCFAGHVDVVPPGDGKLWSHPPFAAEIAGGLLYGTHGSRRQNASARTSGVRAVHHRHPLSTASWHLVIRRQKSLEEKSMSLRQTLRRIACSNSGILILLALASVLLHTLTNNRYGFHRDELAFLDDGRNLAWGYVAYPPLTPFVARVAFTLFGPSLIALRFSATLAISIAMVLTGLMASELGGNRFAQITAAVAAGISPVALFHGSVLMYTSFDYLWWVLTSLFSSFACSIPRIPAGGSPSERPSGLA